MCDSDVSLTESGKQEDEARAKRMAEIDAMFTDDEDEVVNEEELARALEELKIEFDNLSSHTHHCTECEWTGNEEDHEKEGICPNCCGYTEKYEGSKE
jgi:predicted Zn-ribbon and HTH transcriptional regulator